MKGMIIFYVNVNIEHMDKVKPQELIDMARADHIENIKDLKADGWEVWFIPCVGEASRVEKIDLNLNEETKSAV